MNTHHKFPQDQNFLPGLLGPIFVIIQTICFNPHEHSRRPKMKEPEKIGRMSFVCMMKPLIAIFEFGFYVRGSFKRIHLKVNCVMS